MIHRKVTTYHGSEIISEEYRDVTWDQVRAARDKALADSDWRAVKDRTMSQAWKDYRQALRDLGGFDTANDAADNWPEPPE